MRLSTARFVFALLLVFLTLDFASALCSDPIDFYVKVENGGGEAISGAIVEITTFGPNGAVYSRTTGTNGITQTPVSVQGNSAVDISVSADGYAQKFINSVSVDCSDIANSELGEGTQIYDFILGSSQSEFTGDTYVLDEKMIVTSGECEEGYIKTYEFSDFYGRRVIHCVKLADDFTPGIYVNISYIEGDCLQGEVCEICRKGGTGSVYFTALDRSYRLCVDKSYYQNADDFKPGANPIVFDSKMNGADCDPVFNIKEGPFDTGGGNVFHCSKVANAQQPLTPLGNCELSNPIWVNAESDSVSEIFGWETGRASGDIVYPWIALTEACSSETITIDVYKSTGQNPFQEGTPLFQSVIAEKTWDGTILRAYSGEGLELPWTGAEIPGFDDDSLIYYGYKVSVKDSDITTTSNVLSVRRPLEGCQSDSDCEDSGAGYICDLETRECVPSCTSDSDCNGGLFCDVTAGSCVECFDEEDCAEGEVCSNGECTGEMCKFTNLKWRFESGGFVSSTSSGNTPYRAEAEGSKPGSAFLMSADAISTASCREKGVTFYVCERDWVINDFVGLQQSAVRTFVSDKYTLTLPVSGNFLENFFEGDTLEYFFVPVADDIEVDTEEICDLDFSGGRNGGIDEETGLRNSQILDAKLPELADCISDYECDIGYTCSEGECVEGDGATGRECTAGDAGGLGSDCPFCLDKDNDGTKTCIECREDSDCSEGETCDTEGGTYTCTACRENNQCDGQICENNECVACDSDSQCSQLFGERYICRDDKCIQCRVDGDCTGEGESCVDNVCTVAEGNACSIASDCSLDESEKWSCVENLCERKCELIGAKFTDEIGNGLSNPYETSTYAEDEDTFRSDSQIFYEVETLGCWGKEIDIYLSENVVNAEEGFIDTYGRGIYTIVVQGDKERTGFTLRWNSVNGKIVHDFEYSFRAVLAEDEETSVESGKLTVVASDREEAGDNRPRSRSGRSRGGSGNEESCSGLGCIPIIGPIIEWGADLIGGLLGF